MPGRSGAAASPPALPKWQRDRSSAPMAAEPELFCGGPDLTDAERTELRETERRAAEDKQAGSNRKTADRKKERKRTERNPAADLGLAPDGDDAEKEKEKDEDRRAVDLLRQNTDAWGASTGAPSPMGGPLG